MLCPKCGGTMAGHEMHGVPLDRCLECRGLWFDHTALDHVLDKAASGGSLGGTNEFLSAVDATPTDLRCPRCKLHTLLARSHDDIELDWCDTCHGLFLDHHEVETLIAWRQARVSSDRKEFLKAGGRVIMEEGLELLAGFLLGIPGSSR